jgi:competence protein ComGC
MSLIQMIIAFLILVDYIIIRLPNFTYYKKCVFKYDSNDDNNVNKEENDNSSRKANFKRATSIIVNIFKDIKLLYHAVVFIICIITFATQNYRFLVFLLIDVIERSNTLMYIVKSILLPIKQIVFTLFLFYLVAYYFTILVYLLIPDQLPTKDCLKFSDCFFTMCDQTIKNSNGIINYLVEDGLYNTNTLWSNARFWIDNWFAIIDTMLVLQIVAAIIIDTFISQREESKKIEKDKKNKCFICGLKKSQLNKYYHQVNEHIKLDHYLWNYMFVIFNIMQKDSKNLITIDQIIYESYKNKIYSTWIPYKKCKIKDEEDEKEENSKKENKDKDN